MAGKLDATVATSDALSPPAASRLLAQPVHVINVGLPEFARELAANGVRVVHVDWSPPANGDPVLAALLAKLDS